MNRQSDVAVSANSETRDVLVVEVGPRDGLQNESGFVPTASKIAFVNALSWAGLPVIEVTSFVNPKLVPQLEDASEVMLGITREPGVRYPVLVPNAKGLARALDAGVDAIALFTAATESFAQANVGTSIAGTFERFAQVVETVQGQEIWIRGYISVAFGCPYSGAVSASAVAEIAERLFDLGCDEVCLADTIGSAEPAAVNETVTAVSGRVPIERLGLHFHDTSGRALEDVAAGLECGVRIFDAAVGGLGGCPFAPGAPGNLATEALVQFLERTGLRTGVNRDKLADAVAVVAPSVPRLQSGAS